MTEFSVLTKFSNLPLGLAHGGWVRQRLRYGLAAHLVVTSRRGFDKPEVVSALLGPEPIPAWMRSPGKQASERELCIATFQRATNF